MGETDIDSTSFFYLLNCLCLCLLLRCVPLCVTSHIASFSTVIHPSPNHQIYQISSETGHWPPSLKTFLVQLVSLKDSICEYIKKYFKD